MKYKLLTSLLIFSSTSVVAADLDINFSDKQWDGMNIPKGQQCQKFGGESPATPALSISGIPAGTDKIVLEYSDRNSKKMDNGGHGRMSYAIDNTVTTAEIPSVPGHSFELPKPFTMIEKHRGAGWDKEGAYMPPCSGGNGHSYYVTVKAMEGEKVNAETILELGKF